MMLTPSHQERLGSNDIEAILILSFYYGWQHMRRSRQEVKFYPLSVLATSLGSYGTAKMM